MPLREGFDYPLPKTAWTVVKGGKSVFKGDEPRGHQPGVKERSPGPGKYEEGNAQIKATMPNIKGGTRWLHCAPRFKESGGKINKTDVRDYNPLKPSCRPKWNFGGKGGGHKVAMIKGCGADAFYNVKKDYVDCAEVGGILVAGAVQSLGSRCKKVADIKLRSASESRVKNYPRRPGPGHYEDKKHCVLNRSPSYTQTKMNLDKARFPGQFVRSRQWVPPPGAYNDDIAVKKNKINVGARLEQQLGRNSSYSFGSS